jgi:hypothetical protein
MTPCPTRSSCRMPQWDTVRLEAKAGLSHHVAASSFSHGTAMATITATSSSSIASASGDEPTNIYLHLWSSNVEDSFRKASACTKKIIKQVQLVMAGDDSSAASNEMEVVMVLDRRVPDVPQLGQQGDGDVLRSVR